MGPCSSSSFKFKFQVSSFKSSTKRRRKRQNYENKIKRNTLPFIPRNISNQTKSVQTSKINCPEIPNPHKKFRNPNSKKSPEKTNPPKKKNPPPPQKKKKKKKKKK